MDYTKLPERFWRKVVAGPVPTHRPDLGPCWLWAASLRTGGYGQYAHNGTMRRAHKVAYEVLVGPVPAGLDLDHLCRVRRCCNPGHVEPTTRSVNLLRGLGPRMAHERAVLVTHCPQGHEYTPENTHVSASDNGRDCRTCSRERMRRRRAHRDRESVHNGA